MFLFNLLLDVILFRIKESHSFRGTRKRTSPLYRQWISSAGRPSQSRTAVCLLVFYQFLKKTISCSLLLKLCFFLVLINRSLRPSFTFIYTFLSFPFLFLSNFQHSPKLVHATPTPWTSHSRIALMTFTLVPRGRPARRYISQQMNFMMMI
jgi:hypothetical protein